MTEYVSRRRVLAVTAGTAVTAIPGCLADGTSGGETSTNSRDVDPGELGHPAERIEIAITSTPTPAFEPALAHLEVGGTVEWSVADGRHDVTAYHPETYGVQRIPDDATPFASDLLHEGTSFEHTFEQAGIYDYVDTRTVCTTHEVVGAIGRLVVGDPALDEQPAVDPPDGEMPNMAAGQIESLNERTREGL